MRIEEIQPKIAIADDGFTIVELMIATSILAVILLIATVMMMNIGNLFYKGTTQARVQDTTRSVTDDVIKQIELNGIFTSATGNLYHGHTMQAYCMHGTRYSFIVDNPKGSNVSKGEVPFVLWRDYIGPATCSVADLSGATSATPSSGGSELLFNGARLTVFNIQPSPRGWFDVTIGVAYGDSDLLNDSYDNHDPLSGKGTTCKGGAGDQFCAVAWLNSLAGSRQP